MPISSFRFPFTKAKVTKIVFANSGGNPVTITLHSDSSTGPGFTGNPLTITAMNSGTASADRISIAFITGSNRGYATAVEINGIAATMAVQANNGSTGINCEIWYAANPNGTTADVDIEYANSTASCITCALGSITGASGGPSDTDSAGTTGVNSISISALTIPFNGGAVFMGACGDQGTPVTWTNATEFDDDDRTDYRFSAASTITAGTPTITIDGGNGSSHVLVGAAWGPS